MDSSIRSLSAEEQPDIIFAESMGSCTDLIATVVNPLMQFHPSLEIVVSVFADARILLDQHHKTNPLFEEEVQYIYEKQLEEADVLVVNKVDLPNQDQLGELRAYLQKQYPDNEILYQNSLEPENIQNWLATLNSFQLSGKRRTLELDYETYGAGEAKLAWLDEEVEIIAKDNNAMDGAFSLIKKIYAGIKVAGYTIGHLKFLVNDGHKKRKISFVSLHQPEAKLTDENLGVNRVLLLINARVQTEPTSLKQLLAEAIQELKQETDCQVVERKMLAFKPGFPRPTHRIVS
nr:GTP-binding protein [Rufibacter sp. XAAS-G3-1]